MADSEIKTIGKASGMMGRFNFPQQPATCDKHGEFTAYMYPNCNAWSACSKCHADELEAQQQAEFAERRRDAELQERRRLVAAAQIPLRFADRTIENFVAHTDGAKRAVAVARAYVQEFDELRKEGASLIFCGGVGTGKTHLAIGIANAVLDMKLRVRFASVMNAVRTVKETYSRGSDDTERQALNEFISPDLLVLDEVGVQFGSDTEKMILFEIINGRYEQMKPTVVISNLAKEALGEFIGERSIDRLRENGGRLVVFDWASYRRQVA